MTHEMFAAIRARIAAAEESYVDRERLLEWFLRDCKALAAEVERLDDEVRGSSNPTYPRFERRRIGG